MIKTEMIVIGSEFVSGIAAEERSSLLARELSRRGCVVRWKSAVGDTQADIEKALLQAAGRASVIVMFGGLGTIQDSITRKALRRATGVRFVLHEKVLKSLEESPDDLNRPRPANRSGYALLPIHAEIFPNPSGPVPGFGLRWGGSHLIGLPGNADPIERILKESVDPYLSKQFKERSAPLQAVIRTTGLAESQVHPHLNDLTGVRNPVTLGLIPGWAGLDLCFQMAGRPSAESRERLASLLDQIRKRLGEAVYAEGNEDLESVVGRMLAASGLKLAVAESCTGGLIGHRLTDVPGSSAYLDRSVVCYSNRSKIELLGISPELLERHGAVSEPVAAALAEAVRSRSDADLGLAVSGIAGPGGGTPEKPVGLVFFALADRDGVRTSRERFRGERKTVKLEASQKALDLLRRHLIIRKGEKGF
jgi:nicotinamide-nucleotide amidase